MIWILYHPPARSGRLAPSCPVTATATPVNLALVDLIHPALQFRSAVLTPTGRPTSGSYQTESSTSTAIRLAQVAQPVARRATREAAVYS